MKPFILKSKTWIFSHKKTSILLALVLMGVLYGTVSALNKSEEETKYVLATVERGSIISSISGTGQVSASNQVDVSAKTSGDLIYLNAKAGQEVKTGALIAQLDAGDAAYELETAKLSYEELITVDEDELRDVEHTLDQAQFDLEEAYVSARGTLGSSVTDMSDVMADIDTLFDGYLNTTNRFDLSQTEREYLERAESEWYDTDDLLDEFLKTYRTISSATSDEEIEKLLSDANQIANNVAQTTKYTKDAVVYLRDREDNDLTEANEAYITVNELVNTANTTVTETLSDKNTLIDVKRALDDAEYDLNKLKDGPDTLDVRAEELLVKQKQDAYGDYFIRAPFAGIIASVTARKGESVSSGATIATLITKQKVAEISLNEIDVAKVEVGQKATLTFDALEELTISGQVVEVDMVGTVSSGVVNYTVKIGFDTDDDKVKPGMTVTANIIIEMKQDVLAIPASAVKSQGDISYVEIVEGDIPPVQGAGTSGVLLSNPPTRIEVEKGISNDESVEIISGLTEGDQYVARTITSSVTSQSAPSASAPSLFGGGTIRTGGGGGGNFPR